MPVLCDAALMNWKILVTRQTMKMHFYNRFFPFNPEFMRSTVGYWRRDLGTRTSNYFALIALVCRKNNITTMLHRNLVTTIC